MSSLAKTFNASKELEQALTLHERHDRLEVCC